MKDVRVWGVLIVAALVLAACSDKKAGRGDHNHKATDADGEYSVTDDDASGFDLTLSEAEQSEDDLVRPRTVEGEPLSKVETERLLSRLPALPDEESGQAEFAFRKRSKPAPRTGETVQTAFPSEEDRAAPDTGEDGTLEVLRYAPEGDVPLVPKLSLTFSMPMVAVTGQQDASKTVPATIEPEVDGDWRWIGTRTALFAPEGERFPMATDYTVTVPASLESATGVELGKEASKTFTFSTPPVTVERVYPTGGPHRRQPVMFMEFDQKIDREEILEFIAVKGDGQSYPVRAATDDEVAGDQTIKRLVEQARPGQFIVFRPGQALPAATTFNITLKENAPSAEGPKRTKEAQSESFRTYDPLRVERHSCTGSRECPPLAGWYISLNNPLDEESFSPEMVKVEPALPHMEVRASYSSITINGQSKPETTYEVTLDKSLKDRFGQTLGEDVELEMEVGEAMPRLGASAGLMTVLDPAAEGKFPIFSVNVDTVRLRAFEVGAEHWTAYLSFLNERRRNSKATPPGKKVLDEEIELGAEDNELANTLLDLNKALGEDGYGQLVLMVEQQDPTPERRGYYGSSEVVTWVQSTDIALDAFAGPDSLLAWTSALADGSPLGGVEVSLVGGSSTKSDKTGLSTLDYPKASETKNDEGSGILVAKRGTDLAIMPEHQSPWASRGNWVQAEQSPQLLWHVFDDRGMYKPGETAHLKGWVRLSRPTREDRLAASGVERVSYTVYGPRGNKLETGKADVSQSGGFDFALDLPDDVNLGYARVNITPADGEYSGSTTHAFQIQEFRRPEFEVGVSAPTGPHIIGQSATVTVNADYYAGGGLAGAPVQWTVRTSQGQYSPPNRDDYVFGKRTPWWMSRNETQSGTESFSGHTGAAGEHHLKIDFNAAKPPLPTVVEPQASVTDVNRQTWSASANMLVHPSKAYVGIRSEKNFVAKDEPIEIETIVTDIDGKLLAERPVEMSASRISWEYKGGTWKEVEKDKTTCMLTSKEDAQTCTFEPEQGGAWRITAITKDAKGRPNMSQMRVWVAGGETPPNRRAEQQEVELIPDKEYYEVGDTARILVQAPFADAEGLMTVRQNGLVSKERFKVDGQSHTVEVPIAEADYPNIHVQVDLVGEDVRRDDNGEPKPEAGKRPAYARGNLMLKVPPRSRVLSVAVNPDEAETSPGTSTKINVEVTDADGKPAQNAEVAVIAVDEAILALSGYQLRDPIESFYQQQPSGVSDYYFREHLLLASIAEALAANDEAQFGRGAGGAGMEQMEMALESARSAPAPRAAAPTMDSEVAAKSVASNSQKPQPIALRKDFRALALFSPEVRTDQNGKATVDLKLPDNLTRYRLMAVAVDGDDHFGKGESTLTARLPLMVRPSPPRFLNWGDRIELPVVIQNQTDKPAQVKVAVRAANLRLDEVAGKTFEVPARDRVEVRFKAVTEEAGTATLQVATSSGNWADAAQNELPVWTPATTEAFATYGTIDNGSLVQPIKAPSDAIEQFGGLEITTSSTALQALTDALIYLVDYPFECSEQISSRVMGIAALKDVLEAFDAEGLPEPKELVSAVERDIKKLGQLQRPDGGFYLWSDRDHYYFPFVSVHVTHSLQRAKMKGFSVPDEMLERAKRHLSKIERFIPSTYPETAKNAIRAYAYYVLDLMGAKVHDQARALAEKEPGEALSLEAVGWLMATLADDAGAKKRVSQFERFLQNRVSETAATAQFTTSYGGQEHVLMHSSRRTDAIVLDAIMATEPKSDLIPKVVRGLLAHRTKGRWLNTQENVFILLALDRYFQTYEKQTPNFVARMWLGDGYIGEHSYKGRTTVRNHVDVPMKALVEMSEKIEMSEKTEMANAENKSESADGTNLILQKDGKGRLYYRVGMRYAPESLELEPADYGFALERRYEAVDNEDDVTRRDDGTWHIKPGARVRVVLSMVAPARRYHVALVDPLPAGLEPLNPALAVTGDVPEREDEQQRSGYWWWYRPWYSHQNLRDERAEAFASLVWAGVHEYSYVARATTPGEFVVPPTKAEEMYHPETFGRTGTDRVIIE